MARPGERAPKRWLFRPSRGNVSRVQKNAPVSPSVFGLASDGATFYQVRVSEVRCSQAKHALQTARPCERAPKRWLFRPSRGNVSRVQKNARVSPSVFGLVSDGAIFYQVRERGTLLSSRTRSTNGSAL